jgi:hypothetical protein
MSYRTSEEQPSNMPQRGRGASKGFLRFPTATPETKDHSLYRNEDQDTSADTTLGFASQGYQFGQRKVSQGSGGGNFGPVKKDIPRYQVPPKAREGAAKETTIPESSADGSYELRYCSFLQRNVFVQEKDSDTPGLRKYVLWTLHPSS